MSSLWMLSAGRTKAVAAIADESGRPMNAGTTLLAVIVKDGLVYWASVGDSRIYRIKT